MIHPPPRPRKAKACFWRTLEKDRYFFIFFSICISKDAEWSKRMFFMKEKKFVLKEIKGKMSIFYENIRKKVFLMDTLTKNVTKYFSIFFCFRTFCILFLEKNLRYPKWSVPQTNVFVTFPLMYCNICTV